MAKAVKKIHTFLVFALTAILVVLRTVQLSAYTENSFGYIVKGAEGTIALFYSALLLLFLVTILCFCRKEYKSTYNPFENNNSVLSVSAFLCGISLFFDFICRIIIGYNYLQQSLKAEMNYFIPLCFSVIVSLLNAFYFIAAGVSFRTKKYNFTEFKYLHIIPLLWVASVLITCLTENIDVVYAEEELLHYFVLIFAIVFYVLFMKAVESRDNSTMPLGVFGIVYGSFALVLSLPRIFAFVNGFDFSYADFSTVPYLFTGIFALFISKSILGQKKKD